MSIEPWRRAVKRKRLQARALPAAFLSGYHGGMDRFPVPRVLREFSEAFTSSGHQCFLVGGAVRDMALGKEPEDYDIASDALPEEVMKLFRSVIPTGIKHGTVTVRFKGHSIEVTTFRTEADYDDARHPSTVPTRRISPRI
jgi:tRNA nucleotidyltransferase (CCA-adding enzyme)